MSDSIAPPKGDDAVNALWRIPQWFPQLDARVTELLKTYHGELLRFNAKLNLISRNTERDADETHFADCILAVQALAGKLGPVIHDIGSGNGLPGVVLAIMEPTREVHLVDSDARKCEFLKHAVHLLQLGNAHVSNVRVESLAPGSVNMAVARGFATISKASYACTKLFPVGGQFFHMKGNIWSSELAEIPSQLISVWKPELVKEFSLPVSQARRAVVCTQKRQ